MGGSAFYACKTNVLHDNRCKTFVLQMTIRCHTFVIRLSCFRKTRRKLTFICELQDSYFRISCLTAPSLAAHKNPPAMRERIVWFAWL